MSNFSKEEIRGILKQHLIEKTIKQAEGLEIKELTEFPEVLWESSKWKDGPENYCYVHIPKEDPNSRHMLDGQSRYIMISKITGKVVSDSWVRW